MTTALGLRLSLLTYFAIAASGSTPVVTYATYFGNGGETASFVTLGPSGEVIVVGFTTSQDLPGTSLAYQRNKANGFPGNTDIFVAFRTQFGRP